MRNILLIAVGLATIVEVRLLVAALETDNWAGFWYSTLHTVGVAVAVVALLKWFERDTKRR